MKYVIALKSLSRGRLVDLRPDAIGALNPPYDIAVQYVFTLEILQSKPRSGHPPLALLQWLSLSSVRTFMLDCHRPRSQGSSPGSSGNHQPCSAWTTPGCMPEYI